MITELQIRSLCSVRPLKQADRAFLVLPNSSQCQVRLHRPALCCRAKRLSKEEAAAGEWAALLTKEAQVVNEDGGISAEKLNEVCNRGLKLMLQENTPGLLDFQEDLNKIGQTFSERENMQGALFIYVLFKMCDNTIVDQTTQLEGVYLEAFRKVFDILEDSGWRLQHEGEEDEDDTQQSPSSLDDLPALSYMQES